MPAETLRCPMCGASASSDATRCEHCSARLATVACPSCFGMIFQGAKYCSHCGSRADRKEEASATPQPCPRCRLDMKPVIIGNTRLRECGRCEGIWADAASLREICTDREKQAAVLGVANPLPPEAPGKLEAIRYVPCPLCKQLMHRVNFANCSHVVVDVCKAHGTWFDKDELRRIVEFIRDGGLEKARGSQIRQLDDRKRQLKAAQMARPPEGGAVGDSYTFDDRHLGLDAAAAVLNWMLWD